MKRRAALRGVVMAAWIGAAAAVGSAQSFDPKLYADLRWRLVGPFRGGWATCAEGVPEDPAVYYFGAAAGGVWKTEDAGETWTPIFDRAGSASVGAIAAARSNPKVIYVGTGQIQARYDVASGDGVYRSDDAGATWRNVGLAETRAIGRIVVDPRNADVAVVAALGHMFGPNRERGIYRTADGGRSWRQVLFVDDSTGGADLAADPENPDVLYASLWQARNYPWLSYFEPMVGPSSGVYKSKDAGKTWTRLSGGGWPTVPLGRIGLAASHGGRVYALVDAAGEGRRGPSEAAGLYRSDDGGATWARVNATPGIASSYADRVTVDPKNRDVVYLTGQSIRRSADGGRTLAFFKGAPGGDDYHFLWISPAHPERMVTASDQGTVVTLNGGKTWSDWYNQPTGQFYHVETDDRFPYWVYSGQQDSGTAGAATRSDYGTLTFRDWHPVGGEERGWDVPDPEDPLIVYGSGLGGTITRFDTRTGEVRTVSPSVESNYGRRPVAGSYRWNWVFPIAISKKPPHTLYAGSQYLLASDDAGSSWRKASPDLTGAEEGASGCAGAVTVENARPCGFGTIFAIRISPLDAREIWIGTDSGLVQLTRDGGATWKNVTPPGLPVWAKVASVDASALEPGTAYAAVDGHRLDDFSPRLYRTHDFGAAWKEIGAGLPRGSFTTVLRADTVRKGLLYAGTDAGVFVSFDDGENWRPLQQNLPTAWIGDLAVHDNDLVAATQGRAMWILDDVTPLRQLTAEAAAAPSFLFAPAAAIRVRENENRDTPLPPDTPMGKNPPAGAVIDYAIGAGAAGPVHIEVLDAQGVVLRGFRSDAPPERPLARRYFTERWLKPQEKPDAAPGQHRLVWDLRGGRPRAVEYQYTIAAVEGDATIEPRGALVPPGRYTVRLTVGGRVLEQPLTVRPDPRVSIDDRVYQEKYATENRIVEAMSRSYEWIERLRPAHRPETASGDEEERPASAVAPHGATEELVAALTHSNRVLGTLLNQIDAADAPLTGVQEASLAETLKALNEQVARANALPSGHN
ncbi:MAG TPA: hypothetical protein VFA98_05030 [Thermoanaerobaculia bacterium]|nr:hypothetical protein [Thermoanaerobaculia bacterium]